MLSLYLVNQFYNYKWWKLFRFLLLKSQVVWESRETDRICLRTARAHWNKSPSISAKPWFVLFKHFPNPDLSSSIILNALICPFQLYHMPQFVLFNTLKCPDLSFSIISTELTCPLQLYHMPQFLLFNNLICSDLSTSIISNALICPLLSAQMIWFLSSIVSYGIICSRSSIKCSDLSCTIISSKILTFSLIACYPDPVHSFIIS